MLLLLRDTVRQCDTDTECNMKQMNTKTCHIIICRHTTFVTDAVITSQQ